MSNIPFRAAACTLAAIAAVLSSTAAAQGACTQWRVPRPLVIVQGNGPRVTCTLTHHHDRSRGFSGACKNGHVVGAAKGTLDGRRFTMEVDWGGALGQYTAFLSGNGDATELLDGRTYDANRPAHWSTWTSPNRPGCRRRG